jgi:hypothetical protein
LEERHLKHLDDWQGGSMYLISRKVLIGSSPNGIIIYYINIFLFQKNVETLAKIQNRFFLNSLYKKVADKKRMDWDMKCRFCEEEEST